MTSAFHNLFTHPLRLLAEGGALLSCRWAEETLPTDSDAGDTSDSVLIETATRQLSEYAEGHRRSFDLPLSPRGTEFQMKVWAELQRIPYGETVTYAELARRIGRPKACRAVANACGANPLPVIIPCHRVVASGGRPGGYSGPQGIKHTLLSLEQRKTGLLSRSTYH